MNVSATRRRIGLKCAREALRDARMYLATANYPDVVDDPEAVAWWHSIYLSNLCRAIYWRDIARGTESVF